MKFEVLAGAHNTGSKANRRKYRRGETVETEVDLVGMFGANKFRRVDNIQGYTPQVMESPMEDLQSRTVAQLRELADSLEIDLEGARTKDEIISRIEVSR